MKKMLFAVLLFLATDCAIHSELYAKIEKKGFTEEQIVAISEAVYKMGGIVVTSGENVTIYRGDPKDNPNHCMFGQEGYFNDSITLWPDNMSNNQLFRVTMHEVGHIYGFSHICRTPDEKARFDCLLINDNGVLKAGEALMNPAMYGNIPVNQQFNFSDLDRIQARNQFGYIPLWAETNKWFRTNIP